MTNSNTGPIVAILIAAVILGAGAYFWNQQTETAPQSDDPVPSAPQSDSTPPAPAPLTPLSPAAPPSGAESIVSAAQPTGTLDVSLQNEVTAAVNRGLDWLANHQKEDGSWSNNKFPAITALATRAFIEGTHPKKKEIVDKGLKYIVSCVQKDGGIYQNVQGRQGGGLSNYNTAISMMTLHASKDPALVKHVLAARKFIAGAQHFGDDVYKGGFGYDKKTNRAYADLLNTVYASVAMRETADVEDLRPSGEKKVDVNWAETVKFIEKMQNKSDGGTNKGGFFYKPGQSKAGTQTNETGGVIFRSYGSMTYAGVLALIYANVDREDVRVRSAFEWSQKHWTLEENPGMGGEGLFYFYNILTKCLSVYGADVVPLPNGKFINWRQDVAKKLVGLQKVDPKGTGYWKNETGRFWEADPVLVTAYTLLALEQL